MLGKETDTQDISGTVLRVGETEGLTQEQVKDCVMSLWGNMIRYRPCICTESKRQKAV